MSNNRHITLFHAPQTRSAGVLALVYELQADHELHVLNLRAGEQRQEPTWPSTRWARCPRCAMAMH